MNPVIEYAIEHRATARSVLLSRGVPEHDLDDIYQHAAVSVLAANPQGTKNPAAYWYKTLFTSIADHWRRHSRQPGPYSHSNGDGELVRDRADSNQDLDRQIDVREALRQAGDICRTPKEQGAMAAYLRDERLNNAQRQRLHHLRKRLRAAVA